MGITAGRMRGNADEPSDLGFDNHARQSLVSLQSVARGNYLPKNYRIANAIRPRMMISARMLRIFFSNLVTCMGMAADFDPLWQDG
jgi:hypothetical protein